MPRSELIPLLVDYNGATSAASAVEVEAPNQVEVAALRSQVALERVYWPYIMALPLMFIMGFWAMIKIYFNREVLSIRRQMKKNMTPPERKVLRTRLLGATQRITRSFFFDRFGRRCRAIRLGATSWRALNIIYNYRFGNPGLSGILDDFWIGMRNAQAVRNRRRMVVDHLCRIIIQQPGRLIKILSVACGSTQALLEAISLCGRDVELVLVDVDPSAFDMAREIARTLKLKCPIRTFTGTLQQFLGDEMHKRMRFDLVEMVGLLDYMPEGKITALMSMSKQLLEPRGHVLTGHVCPNLESFFLRWVINWNMNYRPPSSLVDLIVQAGFDRDLVRIYLEPQGIHAVAVCRL